MRSPVRTYEVKRGINLRMSIQEKQEISDANVTFLVNNAHTLLHVVFDWSEGGNFRERLPRWLKGVSDSYLEQYLRRRFSWMIVGAVPKKLIPPTPSEKDFSTNRRYKRYLRFHK